jgi:small subunit ribosomal protein S3
LGHKVHPTGFRLGVIKGWESRWYANRNYKDLLAEDQQLRALIRKRLANAGVSRIEIERTGTQLGVTIHTAKPGIVIGKSGESVERLRQLLEAETKKKVRLTILEIRNPEVEATLVARGIAEQLEKRISFRRAMKQAVQKAMRANAKGIKVVCGGRLGGAEIARVEKEVEGSVPLQTLRANIDFGQAEAHTTYGRVGIKVWIYHGDILPEKQRQLGPAATAGAAMPVPASGERGPRLGGERGPRLGGERGGRGPRPGGERGGRGGERGERGGRSGGERSGRAPGIGGAGRTSAAPSRTAPSGGPPRERTVRPEGEGPAATPRAQASEQAPSTPVSSEPQAEERIPVAEEDTAPRSAPPETEQPRPEEE